jgi:hypothetical protein
MQPQAARRGRDLARSAGRTPGAHQADRRHHRPGALQEQESPLRSGGGVSRQDRRPGQVQQQARPRTGIQAPQLRQHERHQDQQRARDLHQLPNHNSTPRRNVTAEGIAMELTLTGDPLPVPDGARNLAARIAANGPVAVAATKQVAVYAPILSSLWVPENPPEAQIPGRDGGLLRCLKRNYK